MFLFVTSYSNVSAIGHTTTSTVTLNASEGMSLDDICGVAGVGLIVAVVGVGMQMVSSAYDLGTYIGQRAAESIITYDTSFEIFEQSPTNFSHFDI
ncbi:hypothetical protein P872_19510 [Rhodonellum psychrophilum GCM71 = DSM 17998]|uniref:Uncharacterized protein n=2 Tax=Rhodonellum TaxID=336827 RepID=U5BYG0_9BACT|nr:hypothetical protein P872_19510 [Rhodonellum psychrophilum GCM71 = DSM 17998]